MSALASAAVPALAVAAFAEFLLVRVALRLGPAFPPGRMIDAGFDAAFWLGLWFLNLAGALAVAVLAIHAARLSRRSGLLASPGITSSGAAAIVVLVAWAFSASGRASTMVLLAQVAAISAAVAVMALTAGWRGWRGWWLLAVAATYLAASTHFFARIAAAPSVAAGAIAAAEAMALAVAALAPAVWRVGWQPRAAALAFTGALLWAGFAASQPHIARFLVIWDLGLSSPLPWWTFGMALACLVYAIAGARWQPAALGFAVVALAGLRLDYTYFGLLALAGFAVLSLSQPPAPLLTIRSRSVAGDRGSPRAARRSLRRLKEPATAAGTR